MRMRQKKTQGILRVRIKIKMRWRVENEEVKESRTQPQEYSCIGEYSSLTYMKITWVPILSERELQLIN